MMRPTVNGANPFSTLAQLSDASSARICPLCYQAIVQPAVTWR